MSIDCDCSMFVCFGPLETMAMPLSGGGEEGQSSRVRGSGAEDSFLGALRRSPERLRSRLVWPVGSRQPFRIHDNGQANGASATCMTGMSNFTIGKGLIGYFGKFWSWRRLQSM